MIQFEDNVLGHLGGGELQPLSGVTVTVVEAATGDAAALFSDDGVTPIVGAITTDSNGYYTFFAADGKYIATFTDPRLVEPMTKHISLDDPADNPFAVADYAALRAYEGSAKAVRVTGYLVSSAPSGVAGDFARDDADTTSADNGGTIIVAANGKRWKREFNDATHVDWFGADPSGTAQSHAAINAAFASITSFASTVEFSRGNYLLGGAITTTIAGLKLRGQSWQGTYFTTPNGSTFDMLRVAHSYVEVEGFQFRPGGDQPGIRVYAARCTIRGNRYLADVNNVGTGIIITDTNPDTTAFVAGAYTHTIENNVIGVAGFAPAIGIDCSSTSGIQATVFHANKILSARCINMPKGGGNSYISNTLQPNVTGVGQGIDLGANTNGETIIGNYIEGFDNGVLMRNLSNANRVAYIVGNHWDNCTNKVRSLGTVNYVYDNEAGTMYENGHTDNCSSTTSRVFKALSGNTLLTLDDIAGAIAAKKRYSTPTTLSYTADAQTQQVTSEICFIVSPRPAPSGQAPADRLRARASSPEGVQSHASPRQGRVSVEPRTLKSKHGSLRQRAASAHRRSDAPVHVAGDAVASSLVGVSSAGGRSPLWARAAASAAATIGSVSCS